LGSSSRVCERHRAGVKRDGEDLDAKLAKLASDHRQLVDQFSRIFNHIAQLMLGPVVTGSVRIKGNDKRSVPLS